MGFSFEYMVYRTWVFRLSIYSSVMLGSTTSRVISSYILYGQEADLYRQYFCLGAQHNTRLFGAVNR